MERKGTSVQVGRALEGTDYRFVRGALGEQSGSGEALIVFIREPDQEWLMCAVEFE